MQIRKLVSNFDYVLFFSIIVLTILGVLFIHSANFNKPILQRAIIKQVFFGLLIILREAYVKQIFFGILSLALLVLVLFIPLKSLREGSIWVYGACIVGLIITLFFGESIMGQRRLQFLGIISIQFSEFMKIAVILFLAHFYDTQKKEIKSLVTYLIGCLIVLVPVGLILLQPDLGSALVFFPILLAVSFIAGVPGKYLLYTVCLFSTIAFIPVMTTINSLYFNNENEIIYLLTNVKYVLVIFSTLIITFGLAYACYLGFIRGISDRYRGIFYWYGFFASLLIIGLALSYPVNSYVLKPYQKDRLLIFFNPYVDPKGKGYHIVQSINTIGNGGITGKGYKKGPQTQKFFLPEQATDFIYPVLAEEMGFIGSILVLIIYALIFYRGFYISLNARDYWSSYITIGILAMMFFHILENIGMCIGIMPITGIPLPFLSYGGSFLMTCYIAVGLIMNVNLSRYQY